MTEKTKQTKTDSPKEYKSIKADLPLYEDIARLAKVENRTMIGQIRHLLETYLKIKK